MSDFAVRPAFMRMNLQAAMIALHGQNAFVSDMRALATADRDMLEQQAMQRRADLVMAYGFAPSEQRKPFAFANGVAIIPIHGSLINRFAYSWGYVTGYNFVRQQAAAAGQDPDVLGVIYDANSYGGEAAGCFETAADLPRLLNGKPSIAVIDSNCYSACYGLSVAADRIICTPSGGAGSIGVVAMHVSFEKLLKNEGIEVNFVTFGEHKVDGNPYQDLTPEVKAEMQKSVNRTGEAFVAHVAKFRKMDEKAVRDTEARVFGAEDAMRLGLIDAVATPSEAMQAFLGELSGSTSQPRKEKAMSNGTQPAADSKATEQAAQEARVAERTRVSAILSCEEAKGRTKLANHLAFNTTMTADEAKGMLAVAAVETAAAPAPAPAANPLERAMDKTEQPNVGADGEGAQGGEKLEGAARILASAKAAGVNGFDFTRK